MKETKRRIVCVCVCAGWGELKKKKKKDSVSFSIVPTVNAMHYQDTKQAITA